MYCRSDCRGRYHGLAKRGYPACDLGGETRRRQDRRRPPRRPHRPARVRPRGGDGSSRHAPGASDRSRTGPRRAMDCRRLQIRGGCGVSSGKPRIKTEIISPDGLRGCFKKDGVWIPGCWERTHNDEHCACERVSSGSRKAWVARSNTIIGNIRSDLQRLELILMELRKDQDEMTITESD